MTIGTREFYVWLIKIYSVLNLRVTQAKFEKKITKTVCQCGVNPQSKIDWKKPLTNYDFSYQK